jgi:flagellar motor switch protein FliM
MATLNPEEVNALMSAIQDGRVAPPAGANTAVRGTVAPYDLTSQDRIIRGQMPTLDAINEQVGSMFGSALAGRTRQAIRVMATPATLLKFADFNAMLSPPSTVCVLSLGTGDGQAIVVLEPGLADFLLGSALGDRRGRPPETKTEGRRELTSVERQVLRRLLTLLTDAMGTAWAPVLALKPQVERFESDPRLAVIAPPNEAAILCAFDISGIFNGRLQLALPYSVVEPVKKLLSSPPRSHGNGNARFAASMAEELTLVEVELRVRLGTAQVRLSKLMELEVGNVLTLGTSEGSSLPVLVEGRPKMSGHPKVVGGGMALVLDRGPEDHIRPPESQSMSTAPSRRVANVTAAFAPASTPEVAP